MSRDKAGHRRGSSRALHKPSATQREFSSHRSSKSQKKRDREQDEIAELRAHQQALRVAAYERLYGTEPPEQAA